MEKNLDKLIRFIGKNMKQIIAAIAVAAVCAPVLVWLCYSVLPPVIYTEITADGMLSYLGTVIGSAVALVVAVVALYQAGMIHKLEQEQADMKRRQEICPSLQMDIFAAAPGVCFMTVSNNSDYPAVGMFLFEYSYAPLIRNDKPVKKNVVFRESEVTGSLYVDPCYVELNEEGYPRKIDLYYTDIDRNTIFQQFRLVEGNRYEPEDVEYMT